MTIYYVNTGTSANSGNGDSLRVAFNKINHNFAQVSNELSAIESGTTSTLVAGTYTFALTTSGNLLLNGQTFTGSGVDLGNYNFSGNILQADNPVFRANDATLSLAVNTTTWTFDQAGTITTPLLLPKTFIATLVPVYGFAPGYNPPGPTGGNAWQYEVHFVVSQDGSTVETQINAPVWPSNPGYKSGDSWTFTEADHGIPGYSFTLILSNVTYPGSAGWTANLEVGEGPEYPSTVHSLGAIKLSSNNASWIFGTDSKLILPQLVGRPTSITLVTGHPMVGYTTGTYGTYVANGSSGTGMTVDVLETDGYNITSIAINQLGYGYTQGQHVYIDGGTGTGEFTVDSVSNQASTVASFGDINLTASTSTWAFNNDGNLQLPTGGSVYFTYGGIRQTDFNSDLFVSSGRGVKIGTDEDSQQWTFSTGGSLTFPSGAQIIADSQDGTYLQANPGIDGYAGLSSLTGNSWMWTANDGGAYISSSDGYTGGTWSFNTNSNLTIPGDIQDANGSVVRVASTSTAPERANGQLWFNNTEGRLYIKDNGVWVDANPTEIPPPSTYLDDITVEGSTFTINGSSLTIDESGTLLVNGTQVTGGSTPAGPTDQITSGSYSVSVDNNGVVTMATSRGNLEFGALPEPGGPSHFHIMRAPGQDGMDLFFGDDYNYVLQRGNSNAESEGHTNDYGVEIGTNDFSGSQQVWRFGTDGTTVFPDNTIKNTTSTNITVLGATGTTSTYAWYNIFGELNNSTSSYWTTYGSVAYDSTGNVYVLGSTVDANNNFYGTNLFLKYSPQGELLWRKTWTDDSGDNCGSYNASMRFQPMAGTATIDTIVWASNGDAWNSDYQAGYIGTMDLEGNLVDLQGQARAPIAIPDYRITDILPFAYEGFDGAYMSGSWYDRNDTQQNYASIAGVDFNDTGDAVNYVFIPPYQQATIYGRAHFKSINAAGAAVLATGSYPTATYGGNTKTPIVGILVANTSTPIPYVFTVGDNYIAHDMWIEDSEIDGPDLYALINSYGYDNSVHSQENNHTVVASAALGLPLSFDRWQKKINRAGANDGALTTFGLGLATHNGYVYVALDLSEISGNDSDLALLKLDAATGALVWARTIGSPSDEYANLYSDGYGSSSDISIDPTGTFITFSATTRDQSTGSQYDNNITIQYPLDGSLLGTYGDFTITDSTADFVVTDHDFTVTDITSLTTITELSLSVSTATLTASATTVGSGWTNIRQPMGYDGPLVSTPDQTWTFGQDGTLTLPNGATIVDTTSTLVLTPNSPAQVTSLVLRSTYSTYLTADYPNRQSYDQWNYDNYGVPLPTTSTTTSTEGTVVAITLWDSYGHEYSQGDVEYVITGTGITAADFTPAVLTGTFLAANWISDGGIGYTNTNMLMIANDAIVEGEETFTVTIVTTGTTGWAATGGNYLRVNIADGTTEGSESGHIHLISENMAQTSIFLGDDDKYVKVAADGQVYINVPNVDTSATSQLWTFSADGSLGFPAGYILPNTIGSPGQVITLGGQGGTYWAPTLSVGDSAPALQDLWFNNSEGRLYIKDNGVWVDANPTVIPPPSTYLDDITVEGSTFTINGSTLTIDSTGTLLVNGGQVTGGGGNVGFEYATIQEGTFGPGGAVTSITGNHGVGLSLTSDNWAQLMWVPDTRSVTIGDIDAGGAVYNWAYVDNQGFHIENKTTSTRSWLFDKDGNIELPGNGLAEHGPARLQSHNGYPTLMAYGSGGQFGLHGGPELDWMDSDTPDQDFYSNSTTRHTLYLNDNGLYIGMNENNVVGSPQAGFTFNTNGNILLSKATTASINTFNDFAISTDKGDSTKTWTFGTDGTLTTPGDITAGGTVYGNGVTIENSNSLNFDQNGSQISEQRPGEGYTFNSSPTTAITGSGTGCLLNISFNAGDDAYQVNVNDGGTYTYNIGDQLKVTGDLLGGVTPDNDLIVEVSQLYPGGTPFAVLSVSIVSGTPATYQDGLHVRVNGLEWTFGTDGSLGIPGTIVGNSGALDLNYDGSVVLSGIPSVNAVIQTTAAGNVSTSTWTFDTVGTLTLPNGSSIDAELYGDGIGLTTDRGTIRFGNQPEGIGGPSHYHIMRDPGTNIDLYFGDDYNYVLQPTIGGVKIGSNIRSGTGTQQTWVFDQTGSTILPDNTLKGYCFTATNTVYNYLPQSAQFLYTDNPLLGRIQSIGGAWYIKGPGLVGWKQITAVQDNSGVALIVRIGSGNTPLPDGSEFNSGGHNPTSPDLVYTISHNLEFDLQVADKTWTFDSTGTLTLPEGGTIKGGGTGTDVTVIATTGTNTATWVFGANGTLTLPTFAGSPSIVTIESFSNISLGSNLYYWNFGTDGHLTFPDATVQTTAYTGTVAYSNITGAPAVVNRTTGSWILATGANTVSITVPANSNYQMWVNGNIPNGIVTWNATVNVSNTNVPAIGVQYGWYYAVGNALVLTSMPNQIVGTAGVISTATVATTSSNVFRFGITNNSVSTQTVYWGYTTL